MFSVFLSSHSVLTFLSVLLEVQWVGYTILTGQDDLILF